MGQVDLLSRLLPSLEEVDAILKKIRKKYLIDEVQPEDTERIKTVSEQLTPKEWEAARQDIEYELRAWFQPKSSALDKVAKLYRSITNNSRKKKRS